MILTFKEIFDLARMTGLPIEDEEIKCHIEDDLETEITIAEHNGKKYAYYTDYPEEGSIELG